MRFLNRPIPWICALILAACASEHREVVYVEREPAAPAQQGEVDVQVDLEQVETELEPHGEWVVIERYGRVWTPHGVPIGWRPYSYGRWVYTDCGWTWVSTWSWGWLPFHYGRWSFAPTWGWVWVPGTVWGPAWVAWRSGPEWYGWAPLPPRAVWHVGVGFRVGGVNLEAGIGHHWWCFVPRRHLLAHRVHEHLVPVARAGPILRGTKCVTRYRWEPGRRRIVNRSLAHAHVAEAVGRPVRQRELRERKNRVGAGRRVTEREVAVFRPPLAARKREPPAPPGTRTRTRSAPRPHRPTSRITPSPGASRRQEEERRAARERHLRIQKRVTERHLQEKKQPPRGVTRVELQKRQGDERRATGAQIRRERQLLEGWHRRETQGRAPRLSPTRRKYSPPQPRVSPQPRSTPTRKQPAGVRRRSENP